MNPLSIESALKSALGASAFPTTAIYCGTSYQEMEPGRLALIVSVEQVSVVGRGLYTASAAIRIVSPAMLGADSYGDFSEVLESMKVALAQDYLLEHWPTNDAPNFCGAWLSSISTGQSGKDWTADLQVQIGVMD